MTAIARTLVGTAPTAILGNQPQAGLRSVATVSSTPVEQASPKSGASLDDSVFLSQAYGRRASDRGERPVDRRASGFVSAYPSFGTLIELMESSEDVPRAPSFGVPGFAGNLARAINTYESNTALVSGASARGTSVSGNF